MAKTRSRTTSRGSRTPRSNDKEQLEGEILEVLGGYKVDLGQGGRVVHATFDLSTPGDYGSDYTERTRRLDDYAKRSRR